MIIETILYLIPLKKNWTKSRQTAKPRGVCPHRPALTRWFGVSSLIRAAAGTFDAAAAKFFMRSESFRKEMCRIQAEFLSFSPFRPSLRSDYCELVGKQRQQSHTINISNTRINQKRCTLSVCEPTWGILLLTRVSWNTILQRKQRELSSTWTHTHTLRHTHTHSRTQSRPNLLMRNKSSDVFDSFVSH